MRMTGQLQRQSLKPTRRETAGDPLHDGHVAPARGWSDRCDLVERETIGFATEPRRCLGGNQKTLTCADHVISEVAF